MPVPTPDSRSPARSLRLRTRGATLARSHAIDSAARQRVVEIRAFAREDAKVDPGASTVVAVEIGQGVGVPGGAGEVDGVGRGIHVRGREEWAGVSRCLKDE